MTTWKVLQKNAPYTEDNGWIEVGAHESEQSYYLGYNAAQKLGEKFGVGEYLLLSDEGEKFKRIVVGAREEFFEVEDEGDLSNGFIGEVSA
jgi:hypothetical protein